MSVHQRVDHVPPRNRLVLTFRVKGADRDYYLPLNSDLERTSQNGDALQTGSSTPVHPMTTQELLAKTIRETQMRNSISTERVKRLITLEVQVRKLRAMIAKSQDEADEEITQRRAQTQKVSGPYTSRLGCD